jgi:iron complex transport system substrate-binding protein
MPATGPRRIVCLTEETTETLYLLGEQDRIAGVSGFTCRPPEARHKPRVSAFTSANIAKILDLRPDLVLGFSNLQAKIAEELIEAGVNVLIFNQRSVDEILDTILMLARIVAAESAGIELVNRLRRGLHEVAIAAARLPRRPRVFFEEWMDPIISGIRWVDELLEIAGGTPIFPHLREQHSAGGRIVEPAAVAAANPEVVIASWCGRKVNPERILTRPGWQDIRHVYEVKSTIILQPGPAALTDGVQRLYRIFAEVTA